MTQPRRKDSADLFIRNYREVLHKLRATAQQAETLTRHILQDLAPRIHLIAARAKDYDSTLWKILRKRYNNPPQQLTDVIGIRVITYHAHDVGPVIERLLGDFEIDMTRSVDKGGDLGQSAFGYRSVHLVARLKGHRSTSPEYATLASVCIEIQVRSILEHAWAEIEHETVYKSGVDFPADVKRRFASVMATLEILEREFLALTGERDAITDEHLESYNKGNGKSVEFDSARLIAFLEYQWPKNPGWRYHGKYSSPFPAHIEARCVAALKDAGLGTARALSRIFRTKRFRKAMSKLEALEVVPAQQISHLALILLALAVKNSNIFRRYLPEFEQSTVSESAKWARRLRH